MTVAEAGAMASDEECLIPDDDLVSALVEDIHLERGAYQIIRSERGSSVVGETGVDLVVLFVLSGMIDVTVGSGDVERLRATDFVLITPTRSFRIDADEASVVGRITYSFDLTRARLLFRMLPPAMVIHGLNPEVVEWHRSLAELIAARGRTHAFVNAAVNRRLVEAALIDTIHQFLARNPPLARPLLMRISPSLQAIHRYPERKWTVASLARLAGMSRTSFAVEFTAAIGETPAHYLTGLRLDRARQMLCRSKLPLAGIAHRAGYGTDVAFSRAFRRKFGVSPGRFRASRRYSPAAESELPRTHYNSTLTLSP